MESTSVGVVPAAACFLAIVFLYSQYNSRSTEDLTHPLWNIFLFRLCAKHIAQGRLLPTPQYRIWITKTEASDFDIDADEGEVGGDDEDEDGDSDGDVEGDNSVLDGEEGTDGTGEGGGDNDAKEVEEDYDPTSDESFRTEAQPYENIVEVISDYVVILPQVRLQVKPDITWLDNNPNLANVKKVLFGLLKNQARFLEMLSHIFPTWTTVREFRAYMPLLVELKRPISRNPSTIQTHTADIRARLREATEQVEEQALCLFKSGKFAHQRWAFLIAASGDFWRFRVMERESVQRAFSKARYVRLKEIEKFGEESHVEDDATFTSVAQNRMAIRKIVANAGKKHIYALEEINEYMGRKRKDTKARKQQTFNHSQEWIASKSMDLSEDIVGSCHWSPVLKIGTEASQSAFSYISGQLDKFVSENGVIIT